MLLVSELDAIAFNEIWRRNSDEVIVFTDEYNSFACGRTTLLKFL